MSAADESHTAVPNLHLHRFLLSPANPAPILYIDEPGPIAQSVSIPRSDFAGLNGQLNLATGRVNNYRGADWKISGVVYFVRVGGVNRSKIIEFNDYLAKNRPEVMPAF